MTVPSGFGTGLYAFSVCDNRISFDCCAATGGSEARIIAARTIIPLQFVDTFIYLKVFDLCTRKQSNIALSGSPTQLRIKSTHRRVRSKRLFGCAAREKEVSSSAYGSNLH